MPMHNYLLLVIKLLSLNCSISTFNLAYSTTFIEDYLFYQLTSSQSILRYFLGLMHYVLYLYSYRYLYCLVSSNSEYRNTFSFLEIIYSVLLVFSPYIFIIELLLYAYIFKANI
ncbi:hypothetical protein DPV78_010800 [Talaromyces pinophilus]|nr:hypothetical protein DPV78_010800 [Talaromyces pinophilus]